MPSANPRRVLAPDAQRRLVVAATALTAAIASLAFLALVGRPEGAAARREAPAARGPARSVPVRSEPGPSALNEWRMFAVVPAIELRPGESLRVAPWRFHAHGRGRPRLGVARERPGEEHTFPIPAPCPDFHRAAWPLGVRVLDDRVLVTASGGLQDPRSVPEHCLPMRPTSEP